MFIQKESSSRFSCNVKLVNHSHVYSVSRCEPNSNEEIRKNCEQKDHDWSVIDDFQKLIRKTPIYSNLTGLIYANIYCAICNQLGSEDDLQPLVVNEAYKVSEYDKDSSQELVKQKLKNDQELQYMMPSSVSYDQFRSCVRFVDTCEKTVNSSQINKCQTGPHAYRFDFFIDQLNLN